MTSPGFHVTARTLPPDTDTRPAQVHCCSRQHDSSLSQETSAETPRHRGPHESEPRRPQAGAAAVGGGSKARANCCTGDTIARPCSTPTCRHTRYSPPRANWPMSRNCRVYHRSEGTAVSPLVRRQIGPSVAGAPNPRCVLGEVGEAQERSAVANRARPSFLDTRGMLALSRLHPCIGSDGRPRSTRPGPDDGPWQPKTCASHSKNALT